ncbi:MAG: hypothetical protein QG573_1897 [Acidobacteriota bacterium]|nr:hypothetical protein [Acidobacteriota bacterium]
MESSWHFHLGNTPMESSWHFHLENTPMESSWHFHLEITANLGEARVDPRFERRSFSLQRMRASECDRRGGFCPLVRIARGWLRQRSA